MAYPALSVFMNLAYPKPWPKPWPKRLKFRPRARGGLHTEVLAYGAKNMAASVPGKFVKFVNTSNPRVEGRSNNVFPSYFFGHHQFSSTFSELIVYYL